MIDRLEVYEGFATVGMQATSFRRRAVFCGNYSSLGKKKMSLRGKLANNMIQI